MTSPPRPGAATLDVTVFDQNDPGERGEAHGELWRDEIAELAEIRIELALAHGTLRNREELFAVARLHLPELARAAPELSAELLGIARGANLSPERVVVLNHYTDLRDIPPSVLNAPSASAPPSGDASGDPGGCTALYVNGDAGPMLGQTWDIHGTAEPFVRLMRIRPAAGEDEVLCFTLTGCLGMTGISATGVAVTINNLCSTDAQVGLVWPALVRLMLAQPNATAARDLLLRTRLSSGRHYMMADGDAFFGVETSGKLKVVTQKTAKTAHVHTNHCFDPKLRRYENIPPASTTFRRMEIASILFVQHRPNTAQGLLAFLSSHHGFPNSICSHIDDKNGEPSAARTCGIMVMSLVGGRVHAVRGCGQRSEASVAGLERWRGRTAT